MKRLLSSILSALLVISMFSACSVNIQESGDGPEAADDPSTEPVAFTEENVRAFARMVFAQADGMVRLWPTEIEKDNGVLLIERSYVSRNWILQPEAENLTLEDLRRDYFPDSEIAETYTDQYAVYRKSAVQERLDNLYGTGRCDVDAMPLLYDVTQNDTWITKPIYYFENSSQYYFEIVDVRMEGSLAFVTFYNLNWTLDDFSDSDFYLYDSLGSYDVVKGPLQSNEKPDSFDAALALLGQGRDDLGTNELILYSDAQGIHIWGAGEPGKVLLPQELGEIRAKTVAPQILLDAGTTPHMNVSAQVGLYLRTGPGKEYDIITLMPFMASVEERGYNSKDDGWVYLDYRGLRGWASTEYLSAEMGMAKPVIYLYPEKEMDVSVAVSFRSGGFTCTYPAYGDGWSVRARPDGTLINHADGLEYSYLYWEGEGYLDCDFSEGFVVKGEETAAFLREKLSAIGLTPREYNEMIVYWLPLMQKNPYNLVTFMTESYADAVRLDVFPAPDSVLRVFMVYKPLDAPVLIAPQVFPAFEREGFVLVEWGGAALF